MSYVPNFVGTQSSSSASNFSVAGHSASGPHLDATAFECSGPKPTSSQDVRSAAGCAFPTFHVPTRTLSSFAATSDAGGALRHTSCMRTAFRISGSFHTKRRRGGVERCQLELKGIEGGR
eukprot:31312-Pelagococcus_subviridis.AAC.19